MAGVKGKSGGPRKNAGGARPGAGRKPKAPAGSKSANRPKQDASSTPVDPGQDSQKREPLEFLEMVMNNPLAPLKDRIRAAVAAAQYRHTKRGETGKKEDRAGAAKKVASGRFKAAPAPLKLVGGA